MESEKYKALEALSSGSEQEHALQMSQNEMTFINIQSKHSIVRWLPINFETDEGTGYNKFTSGELYYSSKFKKMTVHFQPIQPRKATKSSVNKTIYILYVSNST